MKCYGEDGECFIYKNESECNNKKKSIFNLIEGFRNRNLNDIIEGFHSYTTTSSRCKYGYQGRRFRKKVGRIWRWYTRCSCRSGFFPFRYRRRIGRRYITQTTCRKKTIPRSRTISKPRPRTVPRKKSPIAKKLLLNLQPNQDLRL